MPEAFLLCRLQKAEEQRVCAIRRHLPDVFIWENTGLWGWLEWCLGLGCSDLASLGGVGVGQPREGGEVVCRVCRHFCTPITQRAAKEPCPGAECWV